MIQGIPVAEKTYLLRNYIETIISLMKGYWEDHGT